MSREEEVREVLSFLYNEGIESLKMVVSSSTGADQACAFLSMSIIRVKYAFFDGGQFARIGKLTRMVMVPFLYFAFKSLYWSNGRTPGKIMWCSDESTSQPERTSDTITSAVR